MDLFEFILVYSYSINVVLATSRLRHFIIFINLTYMFTYHHIFFGKKLLTKVDDDLVLISHSTINDKRLSENSL